jgi:hypothetical protein
MKLGGKMSEIKPIVVREYIQNDPEIEYLLTISNYHKPIGLKHILYKKIDKEHTIEYIVEFNYNSENSYMMAWNRQDITNIVKTIEGLGNSIINNYALSMTKINNHPYMRMIMSFTIIKGGDI